MGASNKPVPHIAIYFSARQLRIISETLACTGMYGADGDADLIELENVESIFREAGKALATRLRMVKERQKAPRRLRLGRTLLNQDYGKVIRMAEGTPVDPIDIELKSISKRRIRR